MSLMRRFFDTHSKSWNISTNHKHRTNNNNHKTFRTKHVWFTLSYPSASTTFFTKNSQLLCMLLPHNNYSNATIHCNFQNLRKSNVGFLLVKKRLYRSAR